MGSYLSCLHDNHPDDIKNKDVLIHRDTNRLDPKSSIYAQFVEMLIQPKTAAPGKRYVVEVYKGTERVMTEEYHSLFVANERARTLAFGNQHIGTYQAYTVLADAKS